jgi:hypothetical protein
VHHICGPGSSRTQVGLSVGKCVPHILLSQSKTVEIPGNVAAAGPTNEINRLSSLLLRHEGPPHQLSEEPLLTTLIWPGTQYVTDEMTKGLFVPGRKIGKHSAQKGQICED